MTWKWDSVNITRGDKHYQISYTRESRDPNGTVFTRDYYTRYLSETEAGFLLDILDDISKGGTDPNGPVGTG